MKYFRCLIIVLIAATLAGCTARPATTAPNNKVIPFKKREAQITDIKSWKITGGVAIKTPQDAFTASINWRQRGRYHYQINMFGPLGIGAIELIGQPGRATLIDNDNKRYVASSPEALLMQHQGWSMPVSTFYYWVRGIPTPGSGTNATFDQYHHLKVLRQSGWTIRYLSYTGVNSFDLPSKIIMSNRHVRVKLVISHWQL